MTEKDNKKRIISLVVLCVSIVALTTSLTYAYFVSQVGTNEQEKITIKSGDLALSFRDNDETVENTEGTWNFGDSIEKELVIQNTGSRDAYAKISWDNLINTYLAESLTYTLEEKSDDTNAVWNQVETADSNVPRSETASIQVLADHLLIPAGHTYTYRVRITFEDLPDIDQTEDINARFITKFTLDQGIKKLTLEEKLANLNIKINSNNRIDFATPATTDETANGLFSMEDDYGISYYYRGTAPNNYIKFGQDVDGKEIWWRIIRFNGDGTVRMQYDGTGTPGANTYNKKYAIGLNPWNSLYQDNKYAGWMFGGKQGEASTSKEEAQRNETDSEIKIKVEEWYKANIVDTGYSNYVADSIFCNDRSTPGKEITGWENDAGLGYGNNYISYGATARAGTWISDVSKIAPQFTCPQENDKFTVEKINGGNGALTYPVGLITLDEALAAGSGKYNTRNTSYYLYKNNRYWTMSPCYMSKNGSTSAFAIMNIFGGVYYNNTQADATISPVINLKAEYLDKLQGNGTIDNPYTLQIQ